MPDVVAILHDLVRQHSRAGNPILFEYTRDEQPGARISHLPVSQNLAQAWVTLTGAPFRPHQSLALSALRRAEPCALLGGGAAARQTLHLLFYEWLRLDPQGRALLLVPDEATAALHLAELARLNHAIDRALPAAQLRLSDPPLPALHAQVLVVTPAVLHARLLRHCDRAWQPFWSHLRLVALADAHDYHGVAAAHLAGLLLRSLRLVPGDAALPLLAALDRVAGADTVLPRLTGLPWRMVPVDDTPLPPLTIAGWRIGDDRLRETAMLALGLVRSGLSVHIVCSDLEAALLAPLIGVDQRQCSAGPLPLPAVAQIVLSFPGPAASWQHVVTSGARLALLLFGDVPAERTLARLISQPEILPLLHGDQPPAWPAPPTNAYISAQHLLCAASERPISAGEVADWQAAAIVSRLALRGELVELPDSEPAWQPLAAAGDPYAGFAVTTAGGTPVMLVDEADHQLAQFDPAQFDRWGFLGAALPIGSGGYRVVGRSDEPPALQLRAEPGARRRTFPLRRCSVQMREEREQRTLRGCGIGWGRVLIDEEIFGYAELQAGNSPADRNLATPLHASWTAPAVWIDLPHTVRAAGQQVGWSLAAALPLLVLCSATDVVPAYAADQQRMYLVDAQPGGNGLAAWIFTHLEELLPLAYDIALDCRSDLLLEPLARADMDWLLALLGGSPQAGPPARPREQPTPPPPAHEPAQREQARQPELMPLAPLATTSEPQPPAGDSPEPLDWQRKRETAQRGGRRNRGETNSPASGGRRSSSRRDNAGRGRSTGAVAPADERRPAQPVDPAQTAARLPEATPAVDPPPDANAMIARLQRLRAERDTPPADPPRSTSTGAGTAPRFQPGDQVFCMPYGYGEVCASRIVDDRELIQVRFPDYGELEIDSAVSAVRRVKPSAGDSAT